MLTALTGRRLTSTPSTPRGRTAVDLASLASPSDSRGPQPVFRMNRRILLFCVAVLAMLVLNVFVLLMSATSSTSSASFSSGTSSAFSKRRRGSDSLTNTMDITAIGAQLTIWTILRELKDPAQHDFEHIAWLEHMHSYNALNSWLYLDGVSVILFGDEQSCQLAMADFVPPKSVHRVVCEPIPCINEEFGVPQYDCLFARAAEIASTEFLMYSNSDMIYFPDLLYALQKVSSENYDFLMIGRRIDVLVPRKLDFTDPDWETNLLDHVAHYGTPHGKYGIDYFIYRTALSRQMPPFLVGRVRWDNWLLAQYIGSMDAVAVDASEVVQAVHLNHMKVGASHNRTGTEYNINLTLGPGIHVDPKKIGDIESTDLVLVPNEEPTLASTIEQRKINACPKCHAVYREQSLDVMLYKHAVDQTVIVASVNSGYLDFALNWLCSLQRVGLRNYLFHAVDLDMYNSLRSRNLPVVFYESDYSKTFRANKTLSSALLYGSVEYQAVMNSRTEFIYRVLQKGYNVLLSDVDVIFLRNVIPVLNPKLEIQGGAHKGVKITGGFIFFRATAKARAIWVKVLTQHREVFRKIQKMEAFNPHEMTEQELVNQLLQNNKEVAWGTIAETVVADGKRFFIDKTVLTNGEWPYALHNNYIVGHDNKLERFKNISMWLLNEDMSCRAFPRYLPPPPRGDYSITFKIITFNRPKSLQRLLDSLSGEDYKGDRITIEFFIDIPSESAMQEDPNVMQDRDEVIQVAENFMWSHGEKRIILREKPMGLVTQWLNAWFPQSDSEVALFLEDDNTLVSGFYSYLKKALLHYYYNPDNYDPRVFAFNIQQQHMIPGKYPTKPSELLPPDTLYYKYQLLSTWGPVFFPQHWSDFLTWYHDRSSNPSFIPLFSNMVTNEWFLTRGGGRSVWSAWFMRYAAERGLYAIYTNFPNEESFLVNYRDKGVNFKEDKGPSSNPVTETTEEMLNFPAGNQLPIYDFHFNEITEDPSILEDRGLYADPLIDMH